MLARLLQRAGSAYTEHLTDWLLSLAFLPVCLYFCVTRGQYTWLDTADLIIHEAGHFFFRFFGETMHVAGGTLMQILLPLLLAWHFFRQSYRVGVQVMLFWLGHNLLNISVYAADAHARQLPLLGGDRVQHDWHVLLGKFGLLHYDFAIGGMFFLLAVCSFVILLLVPCFVYGEPER